MQPSTRALLSLRILVSTVRVSVVRPLLYASIVVVAALGTLLYKLHTQSLFACPATGYGANSYVAYCQTNGFGDYDHGAFWYGLEPSARRAAADASVLFLGNSRMQFAFSTSATKDWFASHSKPFYLLGFSYGENMLFEEPLLDRLPPKARVYVINVDRFFDKTLVTPPSEALRHDSADTRSGYEEKQRWQRFHERLCGKFSALCGHQVAFYRERDTGTWKLEGFENFKTSAVADVKADADDIQQAQRDAAAARAFLPTLGVPRSCVILTLVPWSETTTAAAQTMADALQLDLVVPKAPNLRTFDGDHLDPSSAERWSAAFYEAAGTRIQNCLDTASAGTR